MRTDVKEVHFECTNSRRTLTKLEDQMSQLMSMMGDIKRKIGMGIPSNTKDNPRREGKEHVIAIALHLGKVLSSPKTTPPKIIVSLEVENEPESKEVITLATKTEKESTKDSTRTKISFPSRLEEKQR
ncbi:acidic leucine-rich nuclear phosphoprotein 32 family member B-like [Gossypium australe]|uniref:Acidic leucine-rich nuclear phosphoprotein 32 family member B-like n=1 Tax=Gossypium australe TaxID=47621 RepID=A0A5B6WR63_9ROSI|nr:acidic leucine-rich nuclear phosphoprotein 32 family member B-like [Gossypium australe]